MATVRGVHTLGCLEINTALSGMWILMQSITSKQENKYMEKIQVETIIHADIQKVWKHWNDPGSIKGWAFASDTWECPYAENDLKVGGKFLTRMSAKDASNSFCK